jgi:hypothetical protein
MNRPIDFRSVLDGIKADRHHLHQILYTLIKLAGACTPLSHRDDTSLMERLIALRSRLIDHFEIVKTDGILDEALSAAPHLTPERASLEQAHRELLSELDTAISGVPTGVPTRAQWLQLAMTIQRFTKHLLAYELAESRLLVQGFNAEFEIA